MPLNCSLHFSLYNDCLSCRYLHENECWAKLPVARKLTDILTIEERIAILEDRREIPPVDIVTITRKDYQQLQRLILSLEEKLNTHIDKSRKRGDGI